jgi:exopolysaccharide biosynthesis protein
MALRDELVAAGHAVARVVFTGEDGRHTTGPWVLHVLEVDPIAFGGDIVPALATDVVPGREPLSDRAARAGSVAALNGGYFVIGAENGTDGDLAGVSILDGALVSEAVLAGTAEGADWLRAHARPGSRIATELGVAGQRGPLALGAQAGVVNGGPRLLRGGRKDITAYAEGSHWPEDPEFFYRFEVRRNPRTLAGVAQDGRLLLVAVDGRRPGYSVGASFVESARLLRALGATDGVNLDGGGSTSLTVGSSLVNRPSDAAGERPIGDALVLRASP